MRLVVDFINFVFYSNLWIALAAIALSAQTQCLLTYNFRWSPLYGVIFFGTLFLYALHRLIGIQKISFFAGQERFLVVEKFKIHIFFYALASGLAGGWFLLHLEQSLILALIPVALISLFYVLPIFPAGKRGRDFAFLKIFLIAFSWSWITVYLPALEVSMTWSISLYIMFLERLFFIFAIALPFDIRDLQVDQFNQVKTLPSRFGIPASKIIAAFVLTSMIAMVMLNYWMDAYSGSTSLALCLSAISTFVLILFSDKYQHDYYFSGLVDGAMILQLILVIAFNSL